jgi:hypothetical protein
MRPTIEGLEKSFHVEQEEPWVCPFLEVHHVYAMSDSLRRKIAARSTISISSLPDHLVQVLQELLSRVAFRTNNCQV